MNAQSVVATPISCHWSTISARSIAEIVAARFFNGRPGETAKISRHELETLIQFAVEQMESAAIAGIEAFSDVARETIATLKEKEAD